MKRFKNNYCGEFVRVAIRPSFKEQEKDAIEVINKLWKHTPWTPKPGFIPIPTLKSYGGIPIHLVDARKHPSSLAALPTKLGTSRVYPNMFHELCLFNYSINHSQDLQAPTASLPLSKTSYDLARVFKNLGIIRDFLLFQKQDNTDHYDKKFTAPRGIKPDNVAELIKTVPHMRVRLILRWDKYATAWSDPAHPITHETRSTVDRIPDRIKHLSKGSQPTFMTIEQMHERRVDLPSGIMLMWHHELGMLVDSQVICYNLPGALALSHVGLPHSMAAQIRGAVRAKYNMEKDKPWREHVKLRDWDMVKFLHDMVKRREAAFSADTFEEQRQAVVHTVSNDMTRNEAERMLSSRRFGNKLLSEVTESVYENLIAHQLNSAQVLERLARHQAEVANTPPTSTE